MQRLAKEVAELFSGPSFRVFTSRDVIGVEIGGAVKNVVAIAAGMCEGPTNMQAHTNAITLRLHRSVGFDSPNAARVEINFVDRDISQYEFKT